MVVGLILGLVMGLTGSAFAAEEKMTRDEYEALVAEYAQRQANGQADLVSLDADIARLKSEIESLDADIASLNSDVLRLVGATEAQVRAFENQVDALIGQLEGLMSLAPEELFHHRGEIEDVATQLAALKGNSIAAIPEMAAKIARVEAMLADLGRRMPRQFSISYEVAKGDHLWGIASNDEIYGDAYMWPRIYRANREQIADPDLIYPAQMLTVPFGVAENQYLVTGGDFLSKIAAAVYDDATMWHKIYKANMAQIVEPNLVFPAQVLEIPAN